MTPVGKIPSFNRRAARGRFRALAGQVIGEVRCAGSRSAGRTGQGDLQRLTAGGAVVEMTRKTTIDGRKRTPERAPSVRLIGRAPAVRRSARGTRLGPLRVA